MVKEEEPEYKETTDIFDILLDKQDKAFKEAVMLHKTQAEVHKSVFRMNVIRILICSNLLHI